MCVCVCVCVSERVLELVHSSNRLTEVNNGGAHKERRSLKKFASPVISLGLHHLVDDTRNSHISLLGGFKVH